MVTRGNRRVARAAFCAGSNSAKSAVSSALHDLVGKRLGLPVFRIWGLDAAAAPESSFTIAIAESHELEQRVAEAREYPILKIKLGTDRDMEIVRIVRNAAPGKAPARRCQRRLDRQARRADERVPGRPGRRDARATCTCKRHRRPSVRAQTVQAARFSPTSPASSRPTLPSSPERSMGSTSSSPSVEACVKRCGWCTPRALSTCR